MKNINGLLVAAFNVLAFALMVSGCAPAVQIGAGLAGSLAGDTLNSSKQSSENGQPVFIEAHHIGNSTVRVFTQFIAFDRNQDFLKIDAYDQDGKKVGGIMRGNQTQVNKYLKEMNANEKKDYINAQFLEVDIDLTPIFAERFDITFSSALDGASSK